ncbi:MAG TPA: hypothetical protein PLM75_11895, partial [bacterium]|nr:hypothetical protein [bacterium]
TFSGTAGLSAIGDSIIVKLYDSFGRNAYDTITVNLFDTPSIKIISPSTNHDTKTSIIVISGTTNNTYSGETITIKTNTTINTTIILASQNANWSGTAALTGLGDSIVVSLQDRFGRMYYDTITVNRWISGFGSASLTSASAVYVLDTITAQITISSTLSGTFMDSITIELPANMSWSGSSGDVTLSGAGFPGGELITISGTGAENDSYIITIHNGQIKSGSDGVVSISNLVCDGGKDHLFGNGAFRFVTKTSAAGNSPTAISSQPQITVNIGIGSLLISEVCAQYAGVADDVFVELYNPTNSKLNLQDVYLKYSAAATQPDTTSSGTQALRRVGPGATMKPRGYYLFGGSSYSGSVSADTTIGSISATGGHVFIVYNNVLLDKFGWGTAQYPEGTAFSSPPVSGEISTMERKAQASSTASSMTTGSDKLRGNSYDTNNNNNDFVKRTDRNPQNFNSTPEPSVSGVLPDMQPGSSVKIARSGKGAFIIKLFNGLSEISNSTISIGIPNGWTTPQKTNSANAGYTSVSITNGSLSSWNIIGNTIAINV